MEMIATIHWYFYQYLLFTDVNNFSSMIVHNNIYDSLYVCNLEMTEVNFTNNFNFIDPKLVYNNHWDCVITSGPWHCSDPTGAVLPVLGDQGEQCLVSALACASSDQHKPAETSSSTAALYQPS